MEGIDLFETYEPVVHWTTVWLMLIPEVLLVSKSRQGDVTAAFFHIEIPENKKVYVELPRLFEQFSKNGNKKNFKLKKTLYGICHSPRAFWKYLTKNLDQSGPKQSKFNLCLFVGDKVLDMSAGTDELLGLRIYS